MLHRLYCKLLIFQRMLAKKLFFTKLYESRVGIKYIMPIYAPTFKLGNDIFYKDACDLFLDFDALKDRYTLCDIPVTESPHFFLMKALQNGDNLQNTDYVKRREYGTLDYRMPHYFSKHELDEYKEKFNNSKTEIESSDYRPVVVYQLKNRYYIADGKHRAAMCALLGYRVKCTLVNEAYVSDSFHLWMCEKMKCRPESYKKNLLFFEQLNK